MKIKVNHYSGLCCIFLMIVSGTASSDTFNLEESSLLRESLTVEGIRHHQKELEKIALNNNGNRFVKGEGYKQSLDYVENQLKISGYQLSRQSFPLYFSENNSEPQFEQSKPEKYPFKLDEDFSIMSQKATLEFTAQIEAVDLTIPSPKANSSTSGCEVSDFSNFTKGNIALIQRGSCTFQTKVNNAHAAGAVGVIIFNEGNPGRLDVISSSIRGPLAQYPVLGASFAVGQKLSSSKSHGATENFGHIKIDVIEKRHMVQNLIAETAKGDETRVLVVGSHLDSVIHGPGINDNGSGSATILSIAQKYAQLSIEPKNKIRFIWFAAEELGLLGSEHYVSSLSANEKKHILAMLNFDMLNSSNYARFVYNGSRASEGSGFIEQIFLDYFKDMGLVSHPTSFDGRSDYGPFIQAGIPAGGLFSGAEGRKSARLAEIYGGIAYAPYDPCYHKSCDDFAHTGELPEYSLALKSLDELSDAAAHAVLALSKSDADIRSTDLDGKTAIEFEYRGNYLLR
ncbi:MAG: M20/M25/M40 family metallo-hydrolase [Myxococcales bacterium]|nr:M20/M25/M40 family metallo-hydrolase [Myxococcales bacterium]USN49860.1 MAG: M20/M25/M40 family metallo-hydrolase [Myxococcales bacterium]